MYEKAEEVVVKCLMPSIISIDDPLNSLQHLFLHAAFMYLDLREAIRWEDGPNIVLHWKWSIPHFLATGCKHYATEAVNFIANLQASFFKPASSSILLHILPYIIALSTPAVSQAVGSQWIS